MIKFKDIILEDNRIVVHCRTQQEANTLLSWVHSKGRTWCNGISYLNNTAWDTHKEFTCYALAFGEVSDTMVYSTTHPRYIISYKEALQW
jgi:hypothetical protein